jgi:hypothetical protein
MNELWLSDSPWLATSLGKWALVGIGALLLLAGRRLFWLALGAIGFLAGFAAALHYLHLEPGGSGLFVALAAGVAGIVLALFVKRLALALAGLVIGGYLAYTLLGGSPAMTAQNGVIVLGTALLTALVAGWLFKKSLALLSSLAGAYLIVAAFAPANFRLAIGLLVGLTALGAGIQWGLVRRRPQRDEDED